ncbi:hypothetical protein [Candidatus Uabimicrobium amorphum]|uniref:Uncharacterized protein n=1 Tax=Uabimicrobium amorphum TaxID=2596890 RepID=A0A5S9II46_UABAM|nr:hypothetical protein [Candidatus Uabimicrobium amorphum]BBM82007.1 hypothetical protein UABAM_00350 [Candidatus Uabimicrobium amorphum]
MRSSLIMCAICICSLVYLWATNENENKSLNIDKPRVDKKASDDCGCAPQISTSGCVTGCGAIPDTTPAITKDEFMKHLQAFANSPIDEQSLDLETLLFYGKETRKWLPEQSILDEDHLRFLQRELQKTHAEIQLRVIDDEGNVRIELEPRIVEIGQKYHEHIHTTHDMQELEISGTIKRVGVHHLWSRF